MAGGTYNIPATTGDVIDLGAKIYGEIECAIDDSNASTAHCLIKSATAQTEAPSNPADPRPADGEIAEGWEQLKGPGSSIVLPASPFGRRWIEVYGVADGYLAVRVR